MSGLFDKLKTNGIDVCKSYTGIKTTSLNWTIFDLVPEVWSWWVGLLQLLPLAP